MLTVLPLSLLASLGWGAAELVGGRCARTIGLGLTLAVSQVVALAAIGVFLAVRAMPPLHDGRLLIGLAGGVVVALELALLYRALSRGPALIIAPIGAVGAALSALAGLAAGDPLDATIGVGLVCAVLGAGACAVGLEDTEEGAHRPPGRRRGDLATALGAALGAAAALWLFHDASRGDPIWATAALRLGCLATSALVLPLAIARTDAPRPRLPSRGQLLALGAIGVTDVAGDLAYATASSAGALSVVSVLSSLYPLVTVALGVAILRERPRPFQLAGAAVACTGVLLLAAAS